MSKKAKLFTTFASLCLAVALLVFGVYAAISAEFIVKSKVFFQATSDVYLTFDASTDLQVYTSATLNANASTDDWQEYTLTKDVSDVKWTTVNPDNSPLAQPAIGEIEIDTYEFRNQSMTTVDGTEGPEEVVVPPVYGYKVVLSFDMTHEGDEYEVTMTGHEAAVAQYTNLSVTFTAEKVAATEEGELDQLVVTYYVVLKDTDSSIGQVDQEQQLQPDDLNLTFTFERATEEAGI